MTNTGRKLEGRGAVVTGGSLGLGRVIVEAFLREGARVLTCGRDPAALARLGRELGDRRRQGRLWIKRADVSKPSAMKSLFSEADRRLGPWDILVNNAGVFGPHGPFVDEDWGRWVRTISTNLLGAAYACKLALERFKKRARRGGPRRKIINLSGGGATAPMPGFSAYGASKAGLVRLTETLAHEAASLGVDVNAVAPGPLNTRFLDQALAAGPGRVGREFYEKSLRQRREGGAPLERGASLCVFLASAESDGITGRLISAIWDKWEGLAPRREALKDSDVYTLRRIKASDRGLTWDG